ncbi:hypothetical protein [Pseudomonas citronellolis]|uniref:hypothetical protein n=1 Tax=Pseudomonas citronellolis TaxID=53408 RepID=UPI00248EE211|nr:hypothetical protein [Pseudomonas citronellolis]
MWVQLAIAVAMMVISYAMTASMNQSMKPEAGSLDIPTADEGDNVPVVFGENLLKNSNVIWYGDPKITKIKSKGGKK